MGLRAQLMATVASCGTKQTQHATSTENSATGIATEAQQHSANPHEIRVSGATDTATGLQQAKKVSATEADFDGQLRVAFTRARNTQPINLTAKRVTSELIKAAMQRCDQFGDGEVAREEMRRQCMELPMHLQADFLDYFRSVPSFQPWTKERD